MSIGTTPLIRHYGVAIAAVAVALLLKFLFDPFLELKSSFLIFFAAVMVSAWYGGKIPGVIATLLSALVSDYFFLSPAMRTLLENTSGQNARLALFVVEGVLVSWIIDSLHRSKRRAETNLVSLQESEEQFRQLSENIYEVFWMADRVSDRILYISPAYERIWGRSCQSLRGNPHSYLEAIHPDDRESAIATFNQQRQGQTTSVEYRVIQPDGTIRWVWDRGFPIFDQAGKVYRVAGVAEDITERKQAEQERLQLLQREQQARAEVELQRSYLHGLLMQAPAFICIHRGPEHVYEFVNARYQKLMGDRNLIGKSVHEALPDLEAQGFFDQLTEVYTTGKPYFGQEVRAHLQRSDRPLVEEGYFNLVYQPMYGLNGSIEGVMAFIFEVTDHVLSRHQSELLAKYLRSQQKALKDSEERYRSLIEATTQIIWHTDSNGEMRSGQMRWCTFTGQTAADYQGLGWLDAVHPEDRSLTQEQWKWAIAHQEPYEVEHRLRRQDGEYRYMSVRAVPVFDQDGTIREWIGVHSDITERKQAEAEREQLLTREQAARAEAEAASHTKDEFLSTLSHELRTPLNAMLGWTQLLRHRKFNESTTSRALETIERNTRSLAQLIDDVLDVSRIITGKLHLKVDTVDLPTIILATVEAVRPAAEAKNIQLKSSFVPSACLIWGDAKRLQQVIWNLVSNAIKFTPDGGRVTIDLVRCESYVRILVSDTGEGIHPSFLPHVFDRFRQADGSTTRAHGGLGLGLSIVRHLVELHGGRVQVFSPGKDQGSTFIVDLPDLSGLLRDKSLSGGSEQASQLVETHFQAPSLEGLRILVVDDEADTRHLLVTVMEQYGAEAIAVDSATAALEIFPNFKPDVLVSDIGMPGEDGYSLMHKVRTLASQQVGNVPAAVALTAYADQENQKEALQAGFQMHMSKPVSPSELAIAVANLTGRLVQH